MALKSGFFNSYDQDRVYDAEDFSRYLEGLVVNGCLPHDTGLAVVVDPSPFGTEPSVIIKKGKAYYDGLWVYNDADFSYSLGPDTTTTGLYHLLYLCFDTNINIAGAGREVTIKRTTNTNSRQTVPANGDGKYYMPLARITNVIGGNPTEIQDLRPLAGVYAIGADTISLVDLSVTEEKLRDLAVATAKLKNLAVTTAKLNDKAVTLAKMAAGMSLFNVEQGSNATIGVLATGNDWVNGKYKLLGATLYSGTPPVNCTLQLSGFCTLKHSHPDGTPDLGITIHDELSNTRMIRGPIMTRAKQTAAGTVALPIGGSINLTAGTNYQLRWGVGGSEAGDITMVGIATRVSGIIVPR